VPTRLRHLPVAATAIAAPATNTSWGSSSEPRAGPFTFDKWDGAVSADARRRTAGDAVDRRSSERDTLAELDGSVVGSTLCVHAVDADAAHVGQGSRFVGFTAVKEVLAASQQRLTQRVRSRFLGFPPVSWIVYGDS